MICFNIIMILWYKIPKYNTRFKRRTKFSKLPLYFPYSCRKLEEFLFVFLRIGQEKVQSRAREIFHACEN